MAEYYVGRCRGCNAALAFRRAPGPGEMEESLSPSWASLILTREPTAKTEPCRCQEFAAAVRTVAPDATPEQVAEWVRAGQAVERLEQQVAQMTDFVEACPHESCKALQASVVMVLRMMGRTPAVDAALWALGERK